MTHLKLFLLWLLLPLCAAAQLELGVNAGPVIGNSALAVGLRFGYSAPKYQIASFFEQANLGRTDFRTSVWHTSWGALVNRKNRVKAVAPYYGLGAGYTVVHEHYQGYSNAYRYVPSKTTIVGGIVLKAQLGIAGKLADILYLFGETGPQLLIINGNAETLVPFNIGLSCLLVGKSKRAN